MEHLLAPALNFGLLLAFLFVKLKSPFKEFVGTRHVQLRDELGRVRSLLKQANEQHEEFSAKLKAVEGELVMLREQAKRDAHASKQRMLAEAQALSAAIVADAKVSAQSLYEDLRSSLRAEIGAQVLARAETLMRDRLTGEDKARIRREFSRQVEGTQ